MGHCIGIAITVSIDLSNRVFNVLFERLIYAAIRKGNQLFVDINVLQPEADPIQVPVRVDVGTLADLILGHHGERFNATDNQWSRH